MRRAVILFLLLVLAGNVHASGPAALEIPRKIIAFYDPTTGIDSHQSPIHQHLEVVLNYLGLDVVHWATTDPLPTAKQMQGVRAIVSWFYDNSAVPDPEAYCQWVSRQMDAGVKWVSLNNIGLFPKNKSELPSSCVILFDKLGAEYAYEQTEDPIFLEIISKDPDMVEFERPLNLTEAIRYVWIKAKDPELHCYLKMRRTDLDESDSCLIFTTPQGGFVQATLVTYENKALEKYKWRINPFRFFTEALQLKDMPAPDVTTINGRRLFMTHIDGDGIFNVSKIDLKKYSGEVILDEVLRAYPRVPFSVSIMTGYLDTPEYSGKREVKLYRDIFSLPNVEPASHGHAHPLIWKKGTVALDVPGYQFDPKFEIQGSTQKLRDLLYQLNIAKPVNSFFWTGDCSPMEQQIAMADEAELLSINGGDSRMDHIADSVAFLRPIGLARGSYRQIYSNFGNENIFTNLWRGPFYGYRDVVESFRNAESPRRLKAIDVYYHYYSGERNESLEVLKQTYQEALSGPVFPIFVSRYIKMAHDYFATKLYHLSGGGFRVINQGHLRTIRLNSKNGQVDLKKSTGVIGFQSFQNQLFVHLDETQTHDIFLTDKKQNQPYIINASFDVIDWKQSNGRVQFLKQGWWKSDAELGGFQSGIIYQVTTDDQVQSVKADAEGRLNLAFRKTEGGGNPTLVGITRESL